MEKNMIKDLTIVIPLGVSVPGTPVFKYLQLCVESIQKQKTSYNYDIIFSCDTNVNDNVKQFLESTNFKIAWYDPFYYFKKGGIWKKIYDQWNLNESRYYAFSHYDDLWSENKIQSQIDKLDETKSDICWSRVQIIDSGDFIINEVKTIDQLTNQTLYNTPTYAFSHSTIVSKKIFDTNIMEHAYSWSAIYEELYYIYSHKLKGIKDNNSIFYHRIHNDSISNTFNDEDSVHVVQQRKETNYSLSETIKDAKSINLNLIRKNISQEIFNENYFT